MRSGANSGGMAWAPSRAKSARARSRYRQAQSAIRSSETALRCWSSFWKRSRNERGGHRDDRRGNEQLQYRRALKTKLGLGGPLRTDHSSPMIQSEEQNHADERDLEKE